MGWRSIAKDGEIRYEGHENPELGGRPVAQGEEGNLLFIEQEDYGHRVGIDLRVAVILIDYDAPATMQNGTLEITNPKTVLYMTDETSIVGEMANRETKRVLKRDEKGRKMRDEDNKLIEIEEYTFHPLTFRPIWFSRHISTLPAPVKVIGVQVTLPESQGGKNVQKMVSLYPDGRIGIS